MSDIVNFILGFLAFVIVDFIVSVILEIIKNKIAIKAQEKKIDSLYLQLIHKIKTIKADLKDESGDDKNVM